MKNFKKEVRSTQIVFMVMFAVMVAATIITGMNGTILFVITIGFYIVSLIGEAVQVIVDKLDGKEEKEE